MFELRKYLWNKMQAANIFDSDDYWADNLNEAIVPILPVQQSPEMNQFLSGKKHIVYDKIGISYENNWLICCEQILFTVYSTDISDIVEIRNFMTDEFRRMDETARDVNYWEGLSDRFKFHSIFIADISPIKPSEEIQGFLATDIILEIKYSRITDNNGRFA
jgi:hypothetical protein